VQGWELLGVVTGIFAKQKWEARHPGGGGGKHMCRFTDAERMDAMTRSHTSNPLFALCLHIHSFYNNKSNSSIRDSLYSAVRVGHVQYTEPLPKYRLDAERKLHAALFLFPINQDRNNSTQQFYVTNLLSMLRDFATFPRDLATPASPLSCLLRLIN
jgi:hypothetical protein